MVGYSNDGDSTQFSAIINILNPDGAEDKEDIVQSLKEKLLKAKYAVDTSCENMANM